MQQDADIASPGKVTLFYISACVLLLLALTLQFYADIGDKVWLLISAHKWLEGKKLYIDIIEVDPPLIIWLYSLPAYLAIHLGLLQAHHYLMVLGIALIVLVIEISLRLIELHPAFANDKKKQAQFCLLLATVFITYQNPLYFLDREHLFLVFTFPYMLRFTPSLSRVEIPRVMRVVIGLLAGIGFSIKPHCLILLAAVNLMYFLEARSFTILKSTENLTIYLIGFCYGATLCIATPAYLYTILPMAWETYAIHNRKLGGIFIFASILLSFGMTFADFRLRYTSPFRRDIFYFLGLALFFLLYALAGNGWGYTWNLLASIGLIINGFVLWEQLYLRQKYGAKGLPVKSFTFGARACVFVFIYNAFIPTDIALLLSPCQNQVFVCEGGQQFIEDIRTVNNGTMPDSFSAMTLDSTMDFSNWPQFTNATGMRWDTHFSELWMVPQFYASGADFTRSHAWIRDTVARAYAEDLSNDRPQVVFVPDTDHFFNVHATADLPEFLGALPEFRQEWKHYRFAGKIEDMYGATHQGMHHGFYVYNRIN